jgi:hypothetical protein
MQPHGSTALTTSTARPITHALALVSALICRVFFPLAHTHTSLSLSLSLSPLGGSFSLSAASAGVAISTPQALRAFAELAWRR